MLYGRHTTISEGLEGDLNAFGIKFEGRREAAQKVDRWFRRVEDGAEVFMRKWHKDEREVTAEERKGGARPHRRSTDGSDGSKTGRRFSCGNGRMRER